MFVFRSSTDKRSGDCTGRSTPAVAKIKEKLRRLQSYVIKVLAGFHDIRSAFCLIDFHPALTEELPARADLGHG